MEMRVVNVRLSHLEERMTILSNYSIEQGIISDVSLNLKTILICLIVIILQTSFCSLRSPSHLA